ncbi:MAG: protein-glutamate O-methyltransferase CheR [Magnetococcus sp. DMHC-8]
MGVSTTISPEEFQRIKRYMREHTGIDIQSGKEYFVTSRLSPLLLRSGCPNFTVLFQKLERDTGALRTQVVDALTTHETLWFRDESFFNALADTVLPQLVAKARRRAPVRIWSAASATGQEAYSVAMLLDFVGRKTDPNFNLGSFFILGTDISLASLATARQGRYNHLAISRGMRSEFLDRYFTKNGDVHEVIPSIRLAVRFEPFNLKDNPTALGMFDLILCRNVLIYFTDDLRQQICERMLAALARPDGYFAVGASESLLGLNVRFKQVPIGRAVLYQPML